VTDVGPLLQHWRKARRLSQLALAAEAAVSIRHLCFVETGRANPSRTMVLRLAEVLDVPLAPVVPVRFARGDRQFDFFSTVTTLGTPQDVTLQELRIECFFPANDATRSQARQLAAAVVGVSERGNAVITR
jgi:transcriptional regulator with XRE-family HTH domain